MMNLQKHQSMGSDRDLQSSSSVSLPSVKKAPKKRRLSMGNLFRRRRDPKRKSKELRGGGGGGDGIASVDSIHSDLMLNDKNYASSVAGAACTSSSSSSSSRGGELLECPLCLLCHSRDSFPDIMTCHHRSCADCLRQYLRIEISESRVNISCPECSERFNPHDIRIILGDQPLMEKYEEFMLRRWLVADPDCRWCPAPDCGYAVIAFGCASCPKITCGREGCGMEFCYHCKQLWHPNQTCDAARQQRAQSLRLRTFSSSSLSYSQESGAAADDIKPCPRCAAYIIKMNDGSCNHMTCAVCGCEFCWLCMKEISDLHYLSPSGCTFWGRKPWSRKKKILWQLGTLVGAPVGIALIAGIAVPAMIIGIPVYVGRKIYNRYEGKDISPHRRNLVIAGGVTLSVIMSPVVAAVSVGIGVPIMLAYVYGVVPISLCRSGGCGVSTGNGKGVRIEFDDENQMTAGSGAQATDTTSVADTRNNPSIGEGSVGGMTGSLSASGSHVDRMGAMRDNLSENASTMALAGASITGSLSGSAMVNYLNRLEVQADVQKERCSLSGESATFSLGTVSDITSTKAMAGSVLHYRDGTSVEVQVDIEPGKSAGHYHAMDDGRDAGRCGWSCPSGCPSEGQDGTAMSSSSSGKKSKSKLKGGGSEIEETREDMDARLLEQQSTNSSESDSPSLSGSLPSVAETLPSPQGVLSPHGSSSDYHTRWATVSPLPEVEGDRLESLPSPQGVLSPPHSPSTSSPCPEVSVSHPHSPVSSPCPEVSVSPPHSPVSSPCPEVSVSPPHSPVSSPCPEVSVSPPHSPVSSPCPEVSVSPPHSPVSSPCPEVSVSPPHSPVSSPCPEVSVSPPHSPVSSPCPEVSVSPPHSPVSSPCPEVSVSPPHSPVSSPCPEVSVSPPHSPVSSPCPEVSVSPPHSPVSSPCPEVSVSPPHSPSTSSCPEVSVSPPHSPVSSPCPEVSVSPPHSPVSSPCPEVSVSPPHSPVSSPCPEVSVSPPHSPVSSPCPEVSVSPPHSPVSSPCPEVSVSPPHSPVSSPCPEVSVSPLCLIAEKNINQVCPAKAECDCYRRSPSHWTA
ncbi:E3 ubiquitin-protein ligase RNF19A-like isoform X6 [Salvelinus fontinalis]|uniref:E3 ubiquitin-protein ligase RNF19A-like isoform X6 n=1 Tax=Salvelinus fontinalis TaxID=8038 RepID=UPI0024861DC4|nr:E3 ubiquitin-protein ligase RNF19A-like isoform X6 [Salvelinus fontinalis]